MRQLRSLVLVSSAVGLLLACVIILLIGPISIAAGQGPYSADAPAAPVGSGFTYQGQLKVSGAPANGQFDFVFKIYDAAAGGVQVGSTITRENVVVANGLFTVKLDFGAGAFGGGARWLDIAVRPGASTGAVTPLLPRQEMSPAPYASALPNVYTDESANFVGVGRSARISGNEVFGIRYTGSANQYGGMYVETSDAAGWPFYGYATNGSFRAWTYYNGDTGSWRLYSAGIRLDVPSTGGLRIGPALDYSLVISNTTGSDGIRVLDTGDDAIQIGSNPDIPNYGVYIPSPGVSTYGLWSNTSNALGEWALYSVDNIQAGNVFAHAYSLVAKATGPDSLMPGDVVAVTGVADSLPGGHSDLPLVRLAAADQFTGLIGVVHSRMVWEPTPGKEEYGLHSSDGPAKSGDYVSLIIYGVTRVKVAPGSRINAGDRVTASDRAGAVRGLQTRTLDGMMVAESAPAIGIALAAPMQDQDTIPVFVTLR
jgi:hypothetical protein